jgi:hypothetical protein
MGGCSKVWRGRVEDGMCLKGEKREEELVESIVLCPQNEGECIWPRGGSRTVVAVNRNRNRNRGSASSVRGCRSMMSSSYFRVVPTKQSKATRLIPSEFRTKRPSNRNE